MLQPVVLVSGDPPGQHTPVGRGWPETATWTNPRFATEPHAVSGWVRQRSKTEEDDVEREEVENQASGNFPEGFQMRMGAFPE